MVIRSRIIPIGNSQGIRIPKHALDQTGLSEDVDLELQPGQIVIRSAHRPRLGWAEQFRAMAEKGEDRLLDGDVMLPTRWDETEWEW